MSQHPFNGIYVYLRQVINCLFNDTQNGQSAALSDWMTERNELETARNYVIVS